MPVPGPIEGLTMFTSAILDDEGRPVAAIGVIDRSGLLSLNELAELDVRLHRQIGGCH